MSGTCVAVARERYPTEADVASGRLFRRIHIEVSTQRVEISSSGTFRAERQRHGVTLLNITNRLLGEPMFQSMGLGSWSGNIYDYAENYDEMRRTAIEFAQARRVIQVNELRNYALKLEELPIEYTNL
jgi:hypothetical protein